MERLRFVAAPPVHDRRRMWVGLGTAGVGGALVLALGAWLAARPREPPAQPVEAPQAEGLAERLGLRRAPIEPPQAEPSAPKTVDELAQLREATEAFARARTLACERLARARAEHADARAIEQLARQIGPCPTAPPPEPPAAAIAEGRAL